MDTGKALSMPVVVGIIAVVVILLGVIGYRMLFTPAESGHTLPPPGAYGPSNGGAPYPGNAATPAAGTH
jgi:hypothetical protein